MGHETKERKSQDLCSFPASEHLSSKDLKTNILFSFLPSPSSLLIFSSISWNHFQQLHHNHHHYHYHLHDHLTFSTLFHHEPQLLLKQQRNIHLSSICVIVFHDHHNNSTKTELVTTVLEWTHTTWVEEACSPWLTWTMDPPCINIMGTILSPIMEWVPWLMDKPNETRMPFMG